MNRIPAMLPVLLLASVSIFARQPLTLAKPLPLGATLKHTQLGIVMDHNGNTSRSYEGKTSLLDFKGKLIILSFWNSNCSSCTVTFQGLSEMQRNNKGKIQIFLVNISEKPTSIRDWIKKMKQQNIRAIPDNLSILTNVQQLGAQFPPEGKTDYHIWLNENGKFLLRTAPKTTT